MKNWCKNSSLNLLIDQLGLRVMKLKAANTITSASISSTRNVTLLIVIINLFVLMKMTRLKSSGDITTAFPRELLSTSWTKSEMKISVIWSTISKCKMVGINSSMKKMPKIQSEPITKKVTLREKDISSTLITREERRREEWLKVEENLAPKIWTDPIREGLSLAQLSQVLTILNSKFSISHQAKALNSTKAQVVHLWVVNLMQISPSQPECQGWECLQWEDPSRLWWASPWWDNSLQWVKHLQWVQRFLQCQDKESLLWWDSLEWDNLVWDKWDNLEWVKWGNLVWDNLAWVSQWDRLQWVRWVLSPQEVVKCLRAKTIESNDYDLKTKHIK